MLIKVVRILILAAIFAGGGFLFAANKTHTVIIEGMKFTPEKLTVSEGDTIEWQNKDFFPHTATTINGFDSKDIKSNASWKYVASKKGEFDYVCRYHPTMKAHVTVK